MTYKLSQGLKMNVIHAGNEHIQKVIVIQALSGNQLNIREDILAPSGLCQGTISKDEGYIGSVS
jgi:hypothetical protein